MSSIDIELWPTQAKIFEDESRIIGAFAGKRGSKTVGMSLKFIKTMVERPNRSHFEKLGEPYIGVLIAPTNDMLHRLTMAAVLRFGAPFIQSYKRSPFPEITLQDGSLIYGVSGDKPSRLEGIKAAVIWIDEVFQVSEQLFLEAKTRVADSAGYLFCTGSLGVQYTNPKQHWAYNYFKKNPLPGTSLYEWATAENPHFPQEELAGLKESLDPETFRQLYEICWDAVSSAAVYSNFNADNIGSYTYNPMLPVYCSIDWGWANPMACLFIQYDRKNNKVYVINEIIQSKVRLDELYQRIHSMPYPIDDFFCDIAGSQGREQLGQSNIDWFRDRGVHFKYRTSRVLDGIALVRSYIKDGNGTSRLLIDDSCVRLIDSIKMYRYKIKDGQILNENPEKKNDHGCDALRYFAVNLLDESFNRPRSTYRRAL